MTIKKGKKKVKSTIELLGIKYFETTGESPEMGFWSWLESMGINPKDLDLDALLRDDNMWKIMKEER